MGKEQRSERSCLLHFFLCELSENRLVSSSYDRTLKLWYINKDILTHIKILEKHNIEVSQIIPLTKNTIAYGPANQTIRV